MKNYFVCLLICFLGKSVLAQDISLDAKVSLRVTNRPLTEVLDVLSSEAQVKFTYGTNINLSQKRSFSFKQKPLRDVLDAVFKPADIAWELIGNQIALSPLKKESYRLSGVLRDSVDKSALPYALVSLRGTGMSVFTDFEGRFIFPSVREGDHVLEIKTFGYRATQQPIALKSATSDLTFYLVREPITLFETIITSDKIIERSSVSQMQLNDRQLDWTKGISNDPLNSLTALPGVLGRVDMYGSSNIHVRGGEAFENQFLLDNIRLSFPFYSIGQSVFNTDMLERAEVLTGGYAPNYGQAMSSVFNLTTKSGDFEKYKGIVDLSVLNNSALVQGPLLKNKLSFIVGVRKNNLDMLTLNDHSKAFFMGDVTGKITYLLNSKTKLSLTSLSVVDNLDFTHSPDFRLKLRAKNNIHAQNFQVQRVLGSKAYSKTSFIHSQLNTASGFGNYYYNTNNNTYNLRQDFSYYPLPAHKIKAGVEASAEDDGLNVSDYYRSTDIAITDTAQLRLRFNINTFNVTSGAYAYYEGTVGKRFLVNAGGRVDYNRYNGAFDLSPRMTLGYELSRSSVFSASWGVFNQAPVLYQLRLNSDLRSNQCQHTILSFKQLLPGGLEARVEAYYKDYRNLVKFDKALRFSNEGYGVAKGLEFIVKKEKGNWSGWASYAWAKSDRRRNLQISAYPFFFDQRHSCNLILNYAARSSMKHWLWPSSYSLDFRFASGAPYTPITGIDTLAGNHVLVAGHINSRRNEGFNNLNLKIVWQAAYGKQKQHLFQFYLDFWNVFSSQNIVARHYTIDKENEALDVTNNYSAPFYPNLGLRFNFNCNNRVVE